MSMLLYGAAGLAGLAMFVVMLGVTRLITAGSEVDDRLQTYANTQFPFGSLESDRPELPERFNNFLSGRSFAAGIATDLARAGVKLTVPEYLLVKVAATLIPFAAFLLLAHQLVPGLVFGALSFVVPDLWLRKRMSRRTNEFVLQLPDTLALITSGLRAGFSLQQSLVNVSKEAPEPTSEEFTRLSQELQLGVPLMDALDHLVKRIKSEDLDMIVSVFKIHSRVGGNLAEVLETVSTTIRERVRLRREVEVITSMQRYSSYVLGLLPVALGLIMLLINPAYILSLFVWGPFLCIPIGAFILTVLGFLVIRKLVDIKV